MIQIEDIIEIAIKSDASDIHLVSGLKPMLRIIRQLKEIEDYDVLTEQDMYEIYDSIVKGNLDKDNLFKETKKLDTSYEYKDTRLRINISLACRMLFSGFKASSWEHYLCCNDRGWAVIKVLNYDTLRIFPP